MFERRRVGGFDRTVPGYPPLDRTRCQLLGDQRRRGDDDAVDDHGRLAYGGLREEAGHRGQVGAGHRREHGERIVAMLSYSAHAVADRGGLADPSGVVDARTPADHLDGFAGGDRPDQDRRRSGVTDSHLPGDQQIRTGVDETVGDGASGREGPTRFVDAECVGHLQVTAATPYLERGDGRVGVGVDRQIGHVHSGTGTPGEHIDGRPAPGDVGHHLRGDLRRVRRHAFAGDAVVAGEHDNPWGTQGSWRADALAGSHPIAQLLEPAQRPRRLGEGELAGTSRFGSVMIGCIDRWEDLGVGRVDRPRGHRQRTRPDDVLGGRGVGGVRCGVGNRRDVRSIRNRCRRLVWHRHRHRLRGDHSGCGFARG